MKVWQGIDEPTLPRGAVVSIGNFDGVHRGHQAMLSQLTAAARRKQTLPIVLTFEPHPLTVLAPHVAPAQLTSLDERLALLESCGLGGVILLPPVREILNLTAQEFFESVLLGKLGIAGMVEGPNFRFGKQRLGDIGLLEQLCRRANVDLEIVPPQSVDGQMVSSSEIRRLVLAGDVATAGELLGRPYRLSGTVTTGAARGRQLGFPTANLAEVANLIPDNGVYAARCPIGDAHYAAAVHIGPNPTFGEGARKLEVHLLDFAGDLYGQTLAVEFVDRVRGLVSFASVDELTRQIQADVLKVRQLTGS